MKIFIFFAKKLFSMRKPSGADDIRKKQMMINPGRSGKELMEEYYVRKISAVLLIITAGLTISAIIWAVSLAERNYVQGSLIERNSYGQGSKNVGLDIYADDELVEKNARIEIGERQYTEEEISAIFDKIGEQLRKDILGENSSADHIDVDLDLLTSVEQYPVNIEWQISDYSVMDGKGRIAEDYKDEKGELIRLTAVLTYGEFHGEYEFFVRVFPRKLGEKEQFLSNIMKRINEYGAATVSYDKQKLPENVDGKRLSYRTAMPETALYVFFLTIAAAFCIYAGKDRELDKAVRKRERNMLLSYPEIVNKLTLLLGAGMTIRAAFEKVAMDHQKSRRGTDMFAYEEMLITVNRMKSGVPEYDAYIDFGKRCALQRYTKLGATLSQNLKKGSQGLLLIMEEEAKDAFEDRKANARKLGEEAGTKLLAPMAMMLMVVMIVVIVPAFMSFGV